MFQELYDDVRGGKKDSERGSFERYGKMKIKAFLSMCVCVAINA